MPTFPSSFTLLAALLALAACSPAAQPPSQNLVKSLPENPITRKAFAASFAKITVGMTSQNVRAILGPPDDIRTQFDPGGISLNHVQEIWGYGSNAHLGFNTLATIAIDDQNQVMYLAGTPGNDQLVQTLGEPELRRLLRLLAQTDADRISSFHPRHIIEAVNAIQPLGKKTGVALLTEYLQTSLDVRFSGDEGSIIVMRALFDPPPDEPQTQPATAPDQDSFEVVQPGYLRPPMLGAPAWFPQGPDVKKIPRFPLVIVDDIPFLPINGYSLFGEAESAAMHLEYIQKAPWRAHPLKPSDDPLAAAAKLLAMLPPEARDTRVIAPAIASQLLRLVDTAYRPPDGPAPYSCCPDDRPDEQQLKTFLDPISKELAPLHLRWNPALTAYTRADGFTFPPLVHPHYRRTILHPRFTDASDYQLEIIIERQNESTVDIITDASHDHGSQQIFQLRALRPGNPPTTLDRQTITLEPNTYQTGGITVTLPAAEQLQIELTHNHQPYTSPPVKP